MSHDRMADFICLKLKERGCRGRVLPVEHVAQLKHEIAARLTQGQIDARVYEKYLSCFEFDVTGRYGAARSIILTAAPQPQRETTFHFNEQTYSVIIPPTYYGDTDDQIGSMLENILDSTEYQLYPAALPLKVLAVSTGMARYGRNNIAYVEEMGSFVRLKAFLSDMPADEADWLEPQVMNECDRCKACLNTCPTGAIAADRFLIHAEKCITFFNENTGNFPGWIDPAWHNSLIGCMQCQLICRANKHFAEWVEAGESFEQAETGLILDEVPPDELPSETVQKLNRGYIVDYLDVLPRNLRALLK